MPQYRFVHLSDIHFGQEKYGDKPIHDDVRVELLRDCAGLRGSQGVADGIIVSGDIAYSGKTDQYRSAGEWLDELTSEVGCPATAVSVVPGNHDIDISQIETVTKLIHEKLRSAPISELDNLLGSIEHDTHNPLLPKLSAYREFAARYGCDFQPPAVSAWAKDLQMEVPNKLSFVGITSVIVSDLTDAVGMMILRNQQYIISRAACTELVVMMHHPVHWFRNHNDVETYLNRARIILTGHEHNPKVRLVQHETGETLWIHAGAANPPGGAEFYTYAYNWMELTHDVQGDQHVLEVKIQPRVWDSKKTKFHPDYGLLKEGEEFLSYSLHCPAFQMPVQKSVAALPNVTKSVVIPDVVEEVRESMNQDNDSFIRLRYLFWKHLDWSARLKVLVELDILPANLNQPIPQTLERLALENASKSGKLKELWSAIMDRIPEDQRETNPF
jgi:hypothetical protein